MLRRVQRVGRDDDIILVCLGEGIMRRKMSPVQGEGASGATTTGNKRKVGRKVGGEIGADRGKIGKGNVNGEKGGKCNTDETCTGAKFKHLEWRRRRGRRAIGRGETG